MSTSTHAVLRKLRKMEKTFSVAEEHNPKFIVEMWMLNTEDPERFGEMVEEAAKEIHEGKKDVVVVPMGACEKLRERGLIP